MSQKKLPELQVITSITKELSVSNIYSIFPECLSKFKKRFLSRFWINFGPVNPTLESIYWRYLESEEIAGVTSNNFNYQSMMEYVQGMGKDYIL